MRKIFSFHVVSADGYDEGPDGEFDWPVVDDEFNGFATAQLDEADTLLFGRRTYEMMAAYWPTTAASDDDPKVAGRMNGRPKIVVSRTLAGADWAGTQVVADLAELERIRRQDGGDVILLGSSALAVALIEAGLLDEVRIMVHPVVLGAGRSLFHTARRRIGLELLGSRTFASGSVLSGYRPVAR